MHKITYMTYEEFSKIYEEFSKICQEMYYISIPSANGASNNQCSVMHKVWLPATRFEGQDPSWTVVTPVWSIGPLGTIKDTPGVQW